MSGLVSRVAALTAVLAALATMAGCGHSRDGDKTTVAETLATSSGSDEVAIEVSTGGGLVLPAVRVSDSLPRVWISGTGRYLRQMPGPDMPALATLEERRIPEAALETLLAQAADAGLLADNPDYGNPNIADAMNTRIVIVSGGKRHEVLVRALGYPAASLDAATTAARERLSHFIDELESPGNIAGAEDPHPYAPTAVAVFVLGPATETPASAPAQWPLGDPPTLGEPTQWPTPSARCLVATGADLGAVSAAAAGITRFVPWRSGDTLWQVAMRPLLPDEQSCADVAG